MCKKKVDNDISNDNHIGCGIVLVLVVLAVFGASWWIIKSHYAGADDFYTARPLEISSGLSMPCFQH